MRHFSFNADERFLLMNQYASRGLVPPSGGTGRSATTAGRGCSGSLPLARPRPLSLRDFRFAPSRNRR